MLKNRLFISIFGLIVLLFIVGGGFFFYNEVKKAENLLYEAAQTKIELEMKRQENSNNETLPVIGSYLLQDSEGSCSNNDDCSWAGEGCGGGHGICTDNPGKYGITVTTCDINPDFPANKGYACGCITEIGKCGWKK